MRKKKKDLEAYENEMINISNKEKEILESYNEEFVEYNEKVNYEDEEFDYKEEVIKEEITKETENVEEIKYVNEKEENIETKEPKKKSKYSALINLVFTIVISILAMIAIDVVSVARYNSGPFFAIPIKEYDDGGTKEYLGFGYRVIDYNQIQGRRDKEIGTLGLKYNIEPINLQDIDLAIEFVDNEEETYKKYYKKFVRIESTLQSIDIEKNTIKLGYQDDGGKYTLDVTCKMASKKEELVNIDVDQKVYVIGTVKKYEFKTKDSNGKLILNDCFASK